MGDDNVSDAVFGLRGACEHSLRFTLGAPVDYPYAPEVAIDNPPPAMFRRIQAVSPPPGRDGGTWATGMSFEDHPLDPTTVPTDRLGEVTRADGLPALDTPDPETVVLDEYFALPGDRRTVTFRDDGTKNCLTSINYWSPLQPGETELVHTVSYYGEFRMTWKRPPPDRWVAVSLDAFWPPERDSADLVIPLGACDPDCPS